MNLILDAILCDWYDSIPRCLDNCKDAALSVEIKILHPNLKSLKSSLNNVEGCCRYRRNGA